LKNYPEKKISDTNSKEPIEAKRLYKSVQNPKTPIRSDNERMPRQYMSIPGTKFERETVLSPYRHTCKLFWKNLSTVY